MSDSVQDETTRIAVSLMAYPTDQAPCPPDNETLMGALCDSIIENQEMSDCVLSGKIQPTIGIHPDAPVLIMTYDDAVEAYEDDGGEPGSFPAKEEEDPYRFMIQLAMYVQSPDQSNDKDLAALVTRLLLESWNSHRNDGKLPPAVAASFRLGGEFGVVEF